MHTFFLFYRLAYCAYQKQRAKIDVAVTNINQRKQNVSVTHKSVCVIRDGPESDTAKNAIPIRQALRLHSEVLVTQQAQIINAHLLSIMLYMQSLWTRVLDNVTSKQEMETTKVYTHKECFLHDLSIRTTSIIQP